MGVPALITAGTEWYALMLQFLVVLSSMAYVAGILCVFSIVWASIVLMAEGSEERNAGKAKAAVWTAVAGLVLVLSARIILAALVAAVPDP